MHLSLPLHYASYKDSPTHTFRITVAMVTCLISQPNHTYFFWFILGTKRKAKMILMLKQTFGPRYQKFGVHTQLAYMSNIGWVPPDHTFLSCWVRLKIVCVHLCLYLTKPLPQSISGLKCQKWSFGLTLFLTWAG